MNKKSKQGNSSVYMHVIMKYFFTALMIVCTFLMAHSQVAFQSRYDIFNPTNITLDTYNIINSPVDSGYFATATISASDSGATVIAYEKSGNISWSKVFNLTGGTSPLAGFQINALPDSTLAINTYASGGTVTINVDFAGNLIMAKKLTPTTATIYKETLVAGALYGVGRYSGGGFNGGLFCKRDLQGNVIWAKSIIGGSDRRVQFSNLIQTNDSGFLLAGFRQIYGMALPEEMVVVKTDSVGNMLWFHQIGYPGMATMPEYFIQTSDNGFLFIVNQFGNSQSGFLKIDSLGNVQWNKIYRNSLQERHVLTNIHQTGPNNYIIAGSIAVGFKNQPLILAIDSGANILWNTQFVGTENLVTFSSANRNQGGLALFGYKWEGFDYSYFLFKTDQAFMPSCTDTVEQYTVTSVPFTDSLIVYSAVNANLSTTDVTSLIEATNYVFSKVDLCPPIFTNLHETGGPEIQVTPVPASDEVTFSINNIENTDSKLLIYDLSGKLMDIQFYNSSSFKYNRKTLANGIYFFELILNNKKFAGKLVFAN